MVCISSCLPNSPCGPCATPSSRTGSVWRGLCSFSTAVAVCRGVEEGLPSFSKMFKMCIIDETLPHVYTYTYTYTYTYIYIHIHIYIIIYISYIYIYVYISYNMYIHIYIYIYICVYHHLEVDRIWDFQADIFFCPDLLKFPYSIYSRMTMYICMYIYIYIFIG